MRAAPVHTFLLATAMAASISAQCSSSGRSTSPGGPATGGAPVPTVPHAAVTGVGATTQLASWRFWWELNKDSYLRLPRGESPQDQVGPVRAEVQAAIARALEGSDQRDLTAAGLVALAKLGEDRGPVRVLPTLRAHLDDLDKRTREAAVIALGISGRAEAADDLIALLDDTPQGRRIVDRVRVEDRTRYFAAYGLGMIASVHEDVDLRAPILASLSRALDLRGSSTSDIRIAAVNALRQFRPGELDGLAKRQHWQCLEALWRYWDRDLGKSERVVQSQVPVAIAELVGRGGGPERARYKKAFAEVLTRGRDTYGHQSAVLALGTLLQAREVDPADAEYGDFLVDYFRRGRDLNARQFCLIALARIGGEHNRAVLLTTLSKCKRTIRPWAGVALGVLSHSPDPDAEIDVTVGRALHAALRKARDPEARSALAVALGLSRYRGEKRDEAAREVAKMLDAGSLDDVVTGYACIGLGLMGYRNASDQLADVLEDSVRRPSLFRQAATGLVLLRGADAIAIVRESIGAGDLNVARRRLCAETFGHLRSKRAGEPLLAMLASRDLSPQTRAVAVVSLGSIFYRGELPWSARIAENMNYVSAISALSQPATDLLPIL